MKAIASVLSIVAFAVCFHLSGSANNNCLESFFKCMIHGATPQQFYNSTVSCCQKLLTNQTYSFLQTYSGCLWDVIDKNIFVKCLNASGRCAKLILQELLRDTSDYQAFNAKAIGIAKPPSDFKKCNKFVIDYGNACRNLCLSNTKKSLKAMCDAIKSLGN